jgi:ATP-dependent DNA ligase
MTWPSAARDAENHLRGCALIDGKRLLAALLEKATGPIKYTEYLEEDSLRVFDNACGLQLEA